MLMAKGEVGAAPVQDRALSRRGLTLTLLTLAYFCSYMDRQILAILQELIRHDLHLTDTQLGLVQGFAFAIFYAGLGIPVAWLADRGNRVNIIAIALALWSAMTAVCGLAHNFVQLLAARVGVGVGEAGSSPPSHSIIADLYPPEKRAGAMAIYTLGVTFGAAAGTILGGAVGQAYGWRVAMFTVGLPGLALAIAIKLFVVEPRRGLSEVTPMAADATDTGLGEGFASLFRDRAARHLIAGVTLISLIGYAHAAFGPSYLQRSLHLTLLQIVTITAPISAVIATVSGVAGGRFANRLAKTNGLHAQAWMVGALQAIGTLPYALLYISGNRTVAIGGLWIALLFVSSYLGPSFALLQGRAPVRLRATWAAITLLCINLVGLGIGPTLVGFMSEQLRPHYGEESLRYALLAMLALAPWPVFHYWRAGVALKREQMRSQVENLTLFRSV